MKPSVGMVVEREFSFTRGKRGRKRMTPGITAPAPGSVAMELPIGRIPRIARLVALSLRFDQLIRDGEMTSFAEIARNGHVTRARVTQIMNLLNLAPDIIDEILHLPEVTKGIDPISEHHLRPIAAQPNWTKQRVMWRKVISTRS